MLTEERHRLILQALKEKEIVKISELTALTDASESTIRRDLTWLEEKKFLKRIHGGAARLQGKLTELSVPEKSSKNIQEKKQIAQYAASIVEDGDCIYLDAGTTTMQMIEWLEGKDIVVVTNGLHLVELLLKKGIRTYLIGGFVKPKTNAMVGRGAIESIRQYRFDKAFIGTNGVHPQYGLTTPDPEEAQVKKQAIDLSREAYVLADEEKFGEISFSKIAEIDEVIIITNSLEDDQKVSFANQTMIKVVTT
ncbi:MAG: DeoR/GlpR transcriptional regulator [Bacillales bacterium]|nr:DeoR/GlpR transcriptional regulator [Bacillales bacterium]